MLRYAAEYKDLGEPLRDFIKRWGGINECASRFARRWAQKITRVRYQNPSAFYAELLKDVVEMHFYSAFTAL